MSVCKKCGHSRDIHEKTGHYATFNNSILESNTICVECGKDRYGYYKCFKFEN